LSIKLSGPNRTPIIDEKEGGPPCWASPSVQAMAEEEAIPMDGSHHCWNGLTLERN
jgi:hypothetical protein